MQLTFLDWAVVALYFAFNIGIGFYYKARAGKNTSEFFLGGRDVPWWLAGTSMVATNPVTTSGVSAAKVVATIDVPANHQGTSRPPRKNSLVFFPARAL